MLKVINLTMEGRYAGPHAFIAACAKKLKNDGIETTVVFPNEDSDFFLKKLCTMGVPAKRLPLHRLTKEKKHLIKYVLFFIPEIILLYNLIKKKGIDIVHCNNSWQFKGIIAGKLAKKKVVWHLHETSTPFLINIIFKFLAKNFADAFITSGEKVRSYYLSDGRLSRKPILEIQAPVDTLIFDPEKVEKDEKIADYSELKIVTVGNVNPLKGIEYFIGMASILSDQQDNLRFFVVGPHFYSQRKYSKKMLQMVEDLELKNFHFYGPSDNVSSVLKAADIYVCSSIEEASPISIWEAMSMAKAIVSTYVGDVVKFINNGENGYVTPIKDAAALAEKVSLLIKDEGLRKKFGQNAREVAVRCLDINVNAKKYVTFYNQLK